jgi:hypothetical protein
MNSADNGTRKPQGYGKTLDRMFNGYLAMVSAITLVLGYHNLRRADGFDIGDWLINYQGGFVRRGLPGDCFFRLGHLIHSPPEVLVLATQYALYALIYIAVWKLVRGTAWGVWATALAFSQVTLGFMVVTVDGNFRKEILFFAALIWLLLLLDRQWFSDLAAVVYLTVVTAIILLSHEGMIVYWPYFIAAVAISRSSILRALRICAVPGSLALVLVKIISGHKGDLSTAEAVCSSLGGRLGEFGQGICGGGIWFLTVKEDVFRQAVVEWNTGGRYVEFYGFMGLLALLPCILGCVSLYKDSKSRRDVRSLLLCTVVSMLGSIALFVYAIDWGRCIRIHIFSLMCLLFYIERRYAKRGQGGPESQPRAAWFAGRHGWLYALMMFLYLTTWSLPSYGGSAFPHFGYYERIYSFAAKHLDRHRGPIAATNPLFESHASHVLSRASKLKINCEPFPRSVR